MTWRERIGRARKAGQFTGRANTIDQLLKRTDLGNANYYESCMVGEFLNATSEDDALEKMTPELEEIGIKFLKAVESNNIEETVRLYNLLHPTSEV